MKIAADSVSLDDIVAGVSAFATREPRDAMYRVATKLIEFSWGDHEEVADGLGVLLLTWNQAFYRYGKLFFLNSANSLEYRPIGAITIANRPNFEPRRDHLLLDGRHTYK
jgi:hypothetical protein